VHRFHRSALHLFRCRIGGLTSLKKVGHMMMNIRGLIVDDPEHTVHLQTLQFATRHKSGSVVEGSGFRIDVDQSEELSWRAVHVKHCRSIPPLRMGVEHKNQNRITI
jgi:hypothetical protein